MALLFARIFAALYFALIFFAAQPEAPAGLALFSGPCVGFLALCFALAHVSRKGAA